MKDRITIVGSGNVAYHLCKIFSEKNLSVSIYGRNETETQKIAAAFSIARVSTIEAIDPESTVLLCVKDDQLAAICNRFSGEYRLAYTSGTVHLNELPKRAKLGVFYPLQSFTKGSELNFESIPILIEANDADFAAHLQHLGTKISQSVQLIDSDQRKHIHLGAVLVNNFSNHLFHLAKQHLDAQQIDWKLLLPLMQETVEKVKFQSPFDAQTGPARRNDLKTIQNQLDLLDGTTKKIYEILSNSIRESYQQTHSDDKKL